MKKISMFIIEGNLFSPAIITSNYNDFLYMVDQISEYCYLKEREHKKSFDIKDNIKEGKNGI